MDAQELMQWRGRDIVDRDGDKIGTFDDLYVDAQSGQPAFALVKTGLFGRRGTFVPLADVDAQGETLRIPFEKAHVKDAPNVEPDQRLSEAEEAEIYRHYGLSPADILDNSSGQTSGPESGSAGNDTGASDSGAGATDDAQPSAGPPAATPGGGDVDGQTPGSAEATGAGAPGGEQAAADEATGRRRLRRYVVTEDTRYDAELVSEEIRDDA